MAFTHRAFLFRSLEFHRRLETQILSGENIDTTSLLGFATKISENASGASLRALESIRFDSSWLDLKDPDSWIGNELYMIALTENVTEAPSLSNRSTLSYQVIERLLPLLGWRIEEVNRLSRGDPLDTLPTISQNQLFVEVFNALSQFGGWLDLASVTTLRAKLGISIDMASGSKTSLISSITNLSTLCGQDPEIMIENAFADATDMLNAAFENKKDLWVILE